MPQNTPTSASRQLPNNQTPRRGITRFFLCLLLLALFLIFFKNSDIFQIFGIFATILSINLFEPIFSVIDRLDTTIWWLLNKLEMFLRALFTLHLPGAGRRIKGNSHVIISSISILLLLYLLFHTLVGTSIVELKDATCLRTGLPIPAAACNSGIGITQLPDAVSYGLITSAEQGRFDTSPLNSQEVQVENLIFQENQQACSGPHVTLVDVTMLSRTIEDPSDSASKGLDDLHGAYLAQHDYNATRASYNPALHGNLPFMSVCLAIANLGTQILADQTSAGNMYTLPSLVKQLVQFSRYDNTFRGIIGFPYSTQAMEALQEFQRWGRQNIPIVSPSATSYKLSNEPNFYRVNPPDGTQGQAMAYYVCNVLAKNRPQATIDIFTNSDAYSGSLSSKFGGAITSCFDQFHIHYEPYQNGNAASIQAATKHAIAQKYTFIFFPGYEPDLDTLQAQIQSSTQDTKPDITILGGDGLEDIENPNHDMFIPVYTTVYASPLKNDVPENQHLIQEYQDQHFLMPYLANAVPGYTLLPQEVIRSYNATKMFTSTLEELTQQNRTPTQATLNASLASVSFDGIGGYFSFQGDAFNSMYISDPQNANLPVYVMCTTRNHMIHLAATYYGAHLIPAQDQCN
jgi:ABC-type branched-subunit amino acid transport system substrate-binding protein